MWRERIRTRRLTADYFWSNHWHKIQIKTEKEKLLVERIANEIVVDEMFSLNKEWMICTSVFSIITNQNLQHACTYKIMQVKISYPSICPCALNIEVYYQPEYPIKEVQGAVSYTFLVNSYVWYKLNLGLSIQKAVNSAYTIFYKELHPDKNDH